jgi:hypothetical protein
MKTRNHQSSILFLLLVCWITQGGCSTSKVLEPTTIPSDIHTQIPMITPSDIPIKIPTTTQIPVLPTPTKNKQDVVIEVVDLGGDPINRAAVRISYPNLLEGQGGWTDVKGSIRFEDVAGFPYTVSVQALGYLSQKLVMDSLPTVLSLRVVLEKDPQSVNTCAPEEVYATARYMKMDLYNSIDYQPDIIVFGSSRAYTISPQYIEELTGRKAFNMALNFGSTLDFYFYAQYIYRTQIENPPKVLLVETQINTINQSKLEGVTPIELWSNLPEEDNFQPEIDLCDQVFDQELNQKYLDNSSSTGSLLWVFQPDGLAIHRPIRYNQYQIALKRQIPSIQERAKCESLPDVSLEYVQKLVDLASQYNTAVIFFRTPFQGDLYNLIREDVRYKQCSNLLNSFMQTLVAEHSNVYFQDLSGYDPIITMDINGFFDAQHLTPEASRLIIDLLLPDIQSALK